MTAEHADAVLAIYQDGIDSGDATFETTAPTWLEFDKARLPGHRFVALDEDGTVLGWTAVTAVSSRCVYRGVVEHSVYVSAAARGRGIGSALLQRLVGSTEDAGIWTIQSGVFPENGASIALHAKLGFRTVGTHERLGQFDDGRWRDVVVLERRSPRI